MAVFKPIKLTSRTHWVGVNDVQAGLFEALWDIPEGVSYNSYLVQGSKKTAIIDLVPKRCLDEHLARVSGLVDPSEIDYLVINHMEPDHTGAIPAFLEKAPNAQLLLTPMAMTLYQKYHHTVPDALLVKGDDTKISLGDETLRFMQTPWLHWPETMSTYLLEDNILFSCDTFGSFGVLPEGAATEDAVSNINYFINGASRKYFATVFYGQRDWVLKAVEKFRQLNLEVQMLAPSHGPVYNVNAQAIMDNWVSWSKNVYSKKVVVAYGSMYGMTAKCVQPVVEAVKEAGGQAVAFNLSESSISEVLAELVDAPVLIIGCPTYEHEIFPKIQQFIDVLRVKKFSNRYATVFGSFSWSGEASRKLTSQLEALGFKLTGKPASFFGDPTPQDIAKVVTQVKDVVNLAFYSLNNEQ